MVTSFLRLLKRYKWFILFFSLGFIFRIILIHQFPQPVLWDQQQSDVNAEKIYYYKIFIDTFRPAGYPIFLAIVYGFVGLKNHFPVYVLQSGIDCFTGVIVYMIAFRLFRKSSIAWTSYILYLFNPYTAAYTGLLLPETITTFLMTVSVYLIWKFFTQRRVWILIALGLTLGIMPQMKISFYYFSILVIIEISLIIIRWFRLSWKDTIGMIMILILSFIVCCFYAMQANFIYYQEASPTIVDYMSVQNLYISLYVDRFVSSPTYTQTKLYPDRVWDMYYEFSTPLSNEARREMAWKYLSRSELIISQDPVGFVTSRVKKLWYIWEKHYLFAYKVESDNPVVNGVVYWYNFSTVIIALIGLITWVRRDGSPTTKYILFILIYIELIHTLTGAEERYSIPAYPLVYLFCSSALISFLEFVKKPRHRKVRLSKS